VTLTRRGRLTVFFGIVIVIFGGGLLFASIYLNSIGVWGSSDPGEPVLVEIPKGAGTEEIGDILEEAGVIESAFGFRIAAFTEGGVSDIQAGKHEIETGLTAPDALNALAESTPQTEVAVNVTFPENLWLRDFARIIEEDTHLSADRFLNVLESGKVKSKYLPNGEANMEGLLFPSTYQVIERDTELDVAQRLADEFEERAKQAGIDDAPTLNLTPYEAITVASMIEAEARHDEERPMIARVIYNRIQQDMTLGIDATVYYAMGQQDPTMAAADKPPLTTTELEIESPYNTRKFPGIPPTPIGASGEASLRAAVAPADGDWLYYVVSDCEGHHSFSVDYQDFLNDKAAYEALEC
jgi:UPF0755 protein